MAKNESTIPLPKEDALRRSRRAQRIATFIAGLSTDRAWEVIVRPFKRKRSNQQNRYERGVVCKLLSEHLGYEEQEVHDLLCGTHFGWKTVNVPRTPNNSRGVKDIPIRTTTKNEAGERDVLNQEDYWDFCAFAQRFGAENGVYIPDPDPLWFVHEPDEDTEDEAHEEAA
jgi:hypothetical protein